MLLELTATIVLKSTSDFHNQEDVCVNICSWKMPEEASRTATTTAKEPLSSWMRVLSTEKSSTEE